MIQPSLRLKGVGLALAGLLVLAACDTSPTPTPIPPAPTATSVPATAAPTDTAAPAPTDTTAPAPTDTTAPAPTNTTAPAPTSTTAPVATNTAAAPAPPPVTATTGGTTSGNNGWQHVLTDTAGVQTLAQAPGVPATLYAGGEKFYRSTDSGTTWTPLTPGFATGEIAVAPSDPQTVYAGEAAGCASGNPGDLHQSTDGGTTWTTRSGGPANIDINPTDPTHLLGIRCDGVYKSTDSGQTWTKLPGTGVTNFDGRYLARGVNDRTVIYAAYLSEGGSLTLGRTTDDGRTWQAAPVANVQGLTSIMVDPLDAKRVYLTAINGFYLSADAGKTWTQHNDGLRLGPGFEGALSTLSKPALDRISSSTPAATSTIYLVNYVDAVNTFILRWNGKGSWELVTTASRLENVTQLLATNDPKASALLALSNTGLYRRALPLPTTPDTDSGTPGNNANGGAVGIWQPVSQQVKDVHVLRTAAAPGSPIYTGGNGVYRSTDGGLTWASISAPFQANEIAIAPSDPQRIYAGTGEACYGSIEPALYRSNDGGGTWNPIAAGPFHFAVSATDPNDLIGLQCAMLMRSRDGKTWQQTAKGDVENSSGVFLARGVDNPAVAYVVFASEGGTARVRRTTNSGATWTTLPNPVADLSGPQDIQVDPEDAEHVYLVTGSGFFASADSGQTWTAQNTGLQDTRPEPDGIFHLGRLVFDTSITRVAGAPVTRYLSSDAAGIDGKTAHLYRWNGQDAWVVVADTPTTNTIDPLVFVPDPSHPALLAANGDTIYRLLLR